MANCPECGAIVEQGDEYCTACGHDLGVEAEPEPAVGGSPSGGEGAVSQSGATGAAATGPPPPPPPPPPTGEAPAAPSAGAGVAEPPKPSKPKAPAMVVPVPKWLAEDWAPAVTFAAGALIAGLVLQYLTGILMVLIQVLVGDGVAWGATLKAPAVQFLALHGPMEGIGLWVTGLAWLGLAFWISARTFAPEESIGGETMPRRRGLFLVKAAITYIVPVGIAVAIVDPTSYPVPLSVGIAGAFGQPSAAGWNVAETFTLGLVAALLLSTLVLARRTGTSPAGFLGLHVPETPRWTAAAFAGARRAVLLAYGLLLALVVIGTLAEALGEDAGFRLWLAFALVVLLAAVLWAALDVATVLMVYAMRFFAGDELVAVGGKPGWIYFGIAIVAAAFFVGGLRGAERYGAVTPQQAVFAGALVGPAVGVVVFVFTWFAIGAGGEITGPGLLLPVLWSPVSALGGFAYARRRGLASGIRFRIVDTDAEGE